MANTLQLYFPQIRERQQVLDDILSKESTKTIYETWGYGREHLPELLEDLGTELIINK